MNDPRILISDLPFDLELVLSAAIGFTLRSPVEPVLPGAEAPKYSRNSSLNSSEILPSAAP